LSRPSAPKPAKLAASVLAGDRSRIVSALEALSEEFGRIDFLSEYLPFDFTDYYEREFGKGLERRIASFEKPVSPDSLADIKRMTNRLEEADAEKGQRRVNIDPGLLSEFNFVLATGKGYAHRVFLRDGIWADLTLIYRAGEFLPLEWTYPDYAGEKIREILKKIRMKYICQLKTVNSEMI
jgi:hypothetical protein